jgi:hypothetical protein
MRESEQSERERGRRGGAPSELSHLPSSSAEARNADGGRIATLPARATQRGGCVVETLLGCAGRGRPESHALVGSVYSRGVCSRRLPTSPPWCAALHGPVAFLIRKSWLGNLVEI